MKDPNTGRAIYALGGTLTVAVGAVAVSILILILLISAEIWLAPGPDASKYNEYVRLAEATKDETVEWKCGDVLLQITHTDQAYEGRKAGFDAPEVPHRYDQISILKGFKEGISIFSTEIADGRSIELKPLSNINNLNIDTAFIVDSNALIKNEESQGLVLSSVGVGDLEKLATCYVDHKEAIQSELNLPLVAFVKSIPGFESPINFECSSGDRVGITANIVRLNDVTEDIIGTIRVDGALIASNLKSSVPMADRNLNTWKSCKSSDGLTLGEYVEAKKKRAVILR